MPNNYLSDHQSAVTQKRGESYRNFLKRMKRPGELGGGAKNYLNALGQQGFEDRMRQASAMSIPGASDVAGLGADAMMYARDPESRTWGNAALSVLGALPFIPAVTYYHGTTKAFKNFDSAAKKTTAGGLNKHGVFLTPDPKVASRYAMDFGPEGANVRMVDFTPQKSLDLSAKDYESLQRYVGKIDKGEALNEVQQITLEDILLGNGVDPKNIRKHPIEAIKSSGFDSISKDAGKYGISEPELLVFDAKSLNGG